MQDIYISLCIGAVVLIVVGLIARRDKRRNDDEWDGLA